MPSKKPKRTKVFISYSRSDASWLQRLRVHLRPLERDFVIDIWDDSKIKPGSNWKEEIEKAVKAAKVAVLLVSADFLASEFIAANELPPLLKAAEEEGAIILPVIIKPSRFLKEQKLSQFQAINDPAHPLIAVPEGEREDVFVRIAERIAELNPPPPVPNGPEEKAEAPPSRGEGSPPAAGTEGDAAAPPAVPVPARRSSKLCDRITDEQWQLLERVAIQAVTTGGMMAMAYYRQEMQWPTGLERKDESAKNPSTIADLQATSAILQAIDPYLSRVARKLGCSLTYLGEETKYEGWLEQNLTQSVYERIHSSESFFTEEDNVIRVILDGIDGTGCFIRGIPLFCSSVGIIISNRPRVSAIYDPIHHILYSALLPGPCEQAPENGKARVWQVATGSHIDLKMIAQGAKPKPLKEEAIAVHLTRTNPKKLHEFLETRTGLADSTLERLARASGAVYAFNSGTVTMVDIAEGALGGFVNNSTNLWDVAPGEVLVQICRGKVTDFDGRPVDYSYAHKVAVVAAKEHLHSTIIDLVK